MAKVMFTEPAEYDLQDIEYYIFVDLCNPSASKRITDGILNVAESLGCWPEKHPLVGDKLLGNVGLRMARFDNYNIFYCYVPKSETVYIIRILYNKVDWESILKRE